MSSTTDDFTPFGMLGWSPPADHLEAGMGVAPIRWTIPLMYAAVNACVLYEGSRFELVGGQLIQATERPSPQFYYVAGVAARVIAASLENSCRRGVLHFSDDTALEPELLVTKQPTEAYSTEHPPPSDALLVGEIAEGTLGYLLGRKAIIYAQAGIPEYWVLDYAQKVVFVHRQPAANGYGTVAPYSAGDLIAPVHSVGVRILVRDLLGLEDISLNHQMQPSD